MYVYIIIIKIFGNEMKSNNFIICSIISHIYCYYIFHLLEPVKSVDQRYRVNEHFT